jgi:hypothetical protein
MRENTATCSTDNAIIKIRLLLTSRFLLAR